MPKVSFAISDEQLTKILKLLFSIPIPTSGCEEEEVEENSKTHITLPTVSAINLHESSKIKSIKDFNDLEIASIKKQKKNSDLNLVEVDQQLFVFEFKVGEVSTLLFSRKFQVLYLYFFKYKDYIFI